MSSIVLGVCPRRSCNLCFPSWYEWLHGEQTCGLSPHSAAGRRLYRRSCMQRCADAWQEGYFTQGAAATCMTLTMQHASTATDRC